MRTVRVSLVLAALMACAAVAGMVWRPAVRHAGAASPQYVLEERLPRRFGTWEEVRLPSTQLVNPQTQQLLDKLYSQLLNRTYVNREGYVIMVSLAYGDDQRGGLQAHMPEVCYPAQGFRLLAQSRQDIVTPYGAIPAQRMSTSLAARHEPVTYWFNLGDQAVDGGSRFAKRLIEIRFGLTGQVPDGMLFRVSSIDTDPARAYRMHDQFVRDLLESVTAVDRARLAGLPG
jgi:EpsI family protein